MSDDRSKDQAHKLVPSPESGKAYRTVSLDVVKSAFLAEGLSAEAIAERYHLPLSMIERLVEENNLQELRKETIRAGLSKIQNEQVNQAQKLLDLELNFKKLRIIQLEKKLEDYLAYYGRHGDFCKRHPVTGAILKDTDGIPMQLHVPNVTKEILQLKESVTLSEGLKKLLTQIDDIINGKPKREALTDGVDDDGVIDIDEFFKKKV